MFIAEKVVKDWTMDQAPQYAIITLQTAKKISLNLNFLIRSQKRFLVCLAFLVNPYFILIWEFQSMFFYFSLFPL